MFFKKCFFFVAIFLGLGTIGLSEEAVFSIQPFRVEINKSVSIPLIVKPQTLQIYSFSLTIESSLEIKKVIWKGPSDWIVDFKRKGEITKILGAGAKPLEQEQVLLLLETVASDTPGHYLIEIPKASINGTAGDPHYKQVMALGAEIVVYRPFKITVTSTEKLLPLPEGEIVTVAHPGTKITFYLEGGRPPYPVIWAAVGEKQRGGKQIPVEKVALIKKEPERIEIEVLGEWMLSEEIDPPVIFLNFSITDNEGLSPLFLVDSLVIDHSNVSIMIVSLQGDVTGDGKISPTDASWILQYLVGKREFTSPQIEAGDISLNGIVSCWDAVLVLQVVVGLIKPDEIKGLGAPSLFDEIEKIKEKISSDLFESILKAHQREIERFKKKKITYWAKIKKI